MSCSSDTSNASTSTTTAPTTAWTRSGSKRPGADDAMFVTPVPPASDVPVVTSWTTTGAGTGATELPRRHQLAQQADLLERHASTPLSSTVPSTSAPAPVPAPAPAPTPAPAPAPALASRRARALRETSISVTKLNYPLRDNFIGHILPALLAIGTLLLLSLGTLRTANPAIVAGVTLAILTVLFVGYLCVPMYDTDRERNVYGWEKVNYVYGHPPVFPFVLQGFLIVAAALVIPFFVIGHGDHKLNWWHRLVGTMEPESSAPLSLLPTAAGPGLGLDDDLASDATLPDAE